MSAHACMHTLARLHRRTHPLSPTPSHAVIPTAGRSCRSYDSAQPPFGASRSAAQGRDASAVAGELRALCAAVGQLAGRMDRLEALLLQAVLGSDLKRELLGFGRYRGEAEVVTAFFERPEDDAVRRLRSSTREEAHDTGVPGQAFTP